MHDSAITNPPITERASTTQCKLGREVWWKICHDGVSNQPQHGQMRGSGNRHAQSSNRKHLHGYGSNECRVPTLKPMPTSYSTIFGHHPPKPFGLQLFNHPPANAQWMNTTSNPSPSRLPQPMTNQQYSLRLQHIP